MKIAFLSSLVPTDIHNWSGTLFYTYSSFSRRNEVIWKGRDVVVETKEFHRANKEKLLLYRSAMYW